MPQPGCLSARTVGPNRPHLRDGCDLADEQSTAHPARHDVGSLQHPPRSAAQVAVIRQLICDVSPTRAASQIDALIAIGEEFLYCVKAAGCADGSAASGRACGLRPVPPYAALQQRHGAADRSLSVVLQEAGDEGEGVDAATFRTAPRPSALPGHTSRARTVFAGTRSGR